MDRPNVELRELPFLLPIIEAYKIGTFHRADIPIRVLNALDSLSQYEDVLAADHTKGEMR